jgi:prepilin peptidase CpaA
VLHAWLTSPESLLRAASVLVVAAAALHDIVARTVPNRLVLLLAAFGASARFLERELLFSLAAAAAVFAIAVFCWRRGWMGGGDVKLLGAACLAAPPHAVPTLLFMMGMAGGLLSLFYLVARRLVRAPSAARPRWLISRALRAERWRIRRGGPLPYACAIAAGGLFVLL